MHKQATRDAWQGRCDSQEDKAYFRYHQMITLNEEVSEQGIGIIGFCCDEGVRRNNGRVGANAGPIAIRKQLASIPWRKDTQQVVDLGDVYCEGNALEAAQQQLGKYVAQIVKNGTAIILGGGHETLYGQYLGVREAVGPHKKIGLLNIDAHFDMREYDEQSSSGTMFKQILDADKNASYFVVGIQPFGNTTALFDRADAYGVRYFLEDELDATCDEALEQFIEQQDVLVVTLCMDVLSAAVAPGVSAPSPFGLDAKTVRQFVRKMTASTKATSFSICEVNPRLDVDNRTAKLGAYFVNEVIYQK